MTSADTPTHWQFLSSPAFITVAWTGFALCFLALCIRLRIRYSCFQRLLADDWIMCIATLLLLGLVVDIQLTIPKTYAGLRVVNGLERPGPDYEKDAKSTLVGLLVNSILAYLALWCIKSSFLAFFWRLTSRVTLFRVLWGIAMFLTTCFGVIAIGTLPFYCHIGELNEIIQRCTYGSGARMTIVALKVTCALDIISDVFILFVPISILWKVKITLARKIILIGLFSLVLVTMAATIVRGGDVVIAAFGSKGELSTVFYYFWLYVEVAMAFIISCVVSFRALFTQRKKEKSAKNRNRPGGDYGRQSSSLYSRMQGKLRHAHDTLLETCKSSENGKNDDQQKTQEENGDQVALVPQVDT